MAELKTYTISTDITCGAVNPSRLDRYLEQSGYINGYTGVNINGDNLVILGDSISSIGSPSNQDLLDILIQNHDGITEYADYKIELDCQCDHKDVTTINYKTDLKSGVAYTPVFHIHKSGENVGLIEKTEYYKNYVDSNNVGELILVVEESYVIDNSEPNLNHSAKVALSRTKTWKWVKDNGEIDQVNTKVRTKLYDTRKKRNIETMRRRDNIVQQLIDHVGLAGVLSGAFTNTDDAYDKLTALQELHSASFTGWKSSGRGSLIGVIETDTTTTWLDTVIPNTAYTQAMCPWMIGMNFRYYIEEKLKGNIA